MLAESQRFTSPQANNWITQTLFILSSVPHTTVITSLEMHWKTTNSYQKEQISSVVIETMQSLCLIMNFCKTTDDNQAPVFYCICFLNLCYFQKVFTYINRKGAQLIMRARFCTGSPEETKGVKGAPASMQESEGAGTQECCSPAPTHTAPSRHPDCPEHHPPSPLHLQQLQWERPKSPTTCSRAAIHSNPCDGWAGKGLVRGGPTPVAGLQPQVWERLAIPEAGFLKLVSVMSTLTEQKVLDHTLPHARWHSDVMQHLISWNLSCQSLQWPQPRCCIPTFLWHRLNSSAELCCLPFPSLPTFCFFFNSPTVLIKGTCLFESSATLLHFLLASYKSLTLISFSSPSIISPRIPSANKL